MFYIAFMFERMFLPNFQDFGKEPLVIHTLVLKIISASFSGFLLLIGGCYLLLHAWMNAFAEILRFGDRTFYKVILISYLFSIN